MKNILTVLIISCLIISCRKNEATISNIKVEGYWNIVDPTYTNNTTRDLYHLFKGDNVYYRFSFLKTHDYSVLTSKPQSDSMISYYQVNGNQLMLPSPSPSASVGLGYPGNNLISQTGNDMMFTRLVVTKRDGNTGTILTTRTDTIRYTRVTDQVKVAYFNNYLKQWHP